MDLYRLEHIRKTFQVGAVAVDALAGVDLEIAEGEIVALQGPSGSGKSTLLNVLGLLETPTSGAMSFCGQTVIEQRDDTLTKLRRDAIGFIFQNFNLVPILSALENVEYPLYLEQKLDKTAMRKVAEECIESVGLTKFAHHRPAELSGGQRQRVAIARALVKHPRVILADEPTANLDSKTAAQIMGLIRGLNRDYKTAVFIATHDNEIAKTTNRIVQIRDGIIVKN